MEKYIETTMENLERNNIKPFYVEKREEVVPLIKTLLKKGESISCGGSVTLHECEVDTKILKSGDYDFIDRSGLQGEELREAYGKAFMCDTFFTSSNAVTERGELYNVDGNSNRVACIVYGPRQVIMVVGKNKIVPNINAAVERVKKICCTAEHRPPFVRHSVCEARRMCFAFKRKRIYLRRLSRRVKNLL